MIKINFSFIFFKAKIMNILKPQLIQNYINKVQ